MEKVLIRYEGNGSSRYDGMVFSKLSSSIREILPQALGTRSRRILVSQSRVEECAVCNKLSEPSSSKSQIMLEVAMAIFTK